MPFKKEFETPLGNKVEDPEGSKVEQPEGAKVKSPDKVEEKFEFPKEMPDISPEVKLKEAELNELGLYEDLKNFGEGDQIVFKVEYEDEHVEDFPVDNLNDAIEFFKTDGVTKVNKQIKEIISIYLDKKEKKD